MAKYGVTGWIEKDGEREIERERKFGETDEAGQEGGSGGVAKDQTTTKWQTWLGSRMHRERRIDGKRETGRAKNQGLPSDPECLRVTVYPRFILCPPFISVSPVLSFAQHPISRSLSSPPSNRSCPLMVLRLAQSATYHRFPLCSIPGRAQPLCERYLGRRTARGNLWCFCEPLHGLRTSLCHYQ